MSSDREIVDAFWRYMRLSQGDRSERLESERFVWAWEEVDRLMARGGRRAVEFLVKLCRRTPDIDALADVGAGPLEELLHEHGESVANAVIEAARLNSLFDQAVRYVEKAELPPKVSEYLRWSDAE